MGGGPQSVLWGRCSLAAWEPLAGAENALHTAGGVLPHPLSLRVCLPRGGTLACLEPERLCFDVQSFINDVLSLASLRDNSYLLPLPIAKTQLLNKHCRLRWGGQARSGLCRRRGSPVSWGP